MGWVDVPEGEKTSRTPEESGWVDVPPGAKIAPSSGLSMLDDDTRMTLKGLGWQDEEIDQYYGKGKRKKDTTIQADTGGDSVVDRVRSWFNREVMGNMGMAPGDIADAQIRQEARRAGLPMETYINKLHPDGKALNKIQSMVKASAAGSIGTAEGLAGGIEWLTDGKYGQSFANQARLWVHELTPEEAGFEYSLASGVGSMATFFIPGVGVQVGAARLAAVSAKAARWIGTSTMATMEAMTEAGQVYRDVMEKSGDRGEANTAANITFWLNLPLLTVTDKLGLFAEKGGVVRKTIGGSLMEGTQEAGQEIISTKAKGEPISWLNVLESGAVGAITGGAAAGIKARIDRGMPQKNPAPGSAEPVAEGNISTPQEGVVTAAKEEPGQQPQGTTPASPPTIDDYVDKDDTLTPEQYQAYREYLTEEGMIKDDSVFDGDGTLNVDRASAQYTPEESTSIKGAIARVMNLADRLGVAIDDITVEQTERVLDHSLPEVQELIRTAGYTDQEVADAIARGERFRIAGEHEKIVDPESGQRRSRIRLYVGHRPEDVYHEFVHAVEYQGGLAGWRGTPEQHARYLEQVLTEGREGSLPEFTEEGSRVLDILPYRVTIGERSETPSGTPQARGPGSTGSVTGKRAGSEGVSLIPALQKATPSTDYAIRIDTVTEQGPVSVAKGTVISSTGQGRPVEISYPHRDFSQFGTAHHDAVALAQWQQLYNAVSDEVRANVINIDIPDKNKLQGQPLMALSTGCGRNAAVLSAIDAGIIPPSTSEYLVSCHGACYKNYDNWALARGVPFSDLIAAARAVATANESQVKKLATENRVPKEKIREGLAYLQKIAREELGVPITDDIIRDVAKTDKILKGAYNNASLDAKKKIWERVIDDGWVRPWAPQEAQAPIVATASQAAEYVKNLRQHNIQTILDTPSTFIRGNQAGDWLHEVNTGAWQEFVRAMISRGVGPQAKRPKKFSVVTAGWYVDVPFDELRAIAKEFGKEGKDALIVQVTGPIDFSSQEAALRLRGYHKLRAAGLNPVMRLITDNFGQGGQFLTNPDAVRMTLDYIIQTGLTPNNILETPLHIDAPGFKVLDPKKIPVVATRIQGLFDVSGEDAEAMARGILKYNETRHGEGGGEQFLGLTYGTLREGGLITPQQEAALKGRGFLYEMTMPNGTREEGVFPARCCTTGKCTTCTYACMSKIKTAVKKSPTTFTKLFDEIDPDGVAAAVSDDTVAYSIRSGKPEGEQKENLTGQNLFSDIQYEYETTPQTEAIVSDIQRTAGAVSSGAGLQQVSSRVPGDNQPRTVYRAIKDFVSKGWIDLRGHTVKSPAELALLAQVYRDPRVETLRIFYVAGDTILAHEGVSSNMPGFTGTPHGFTKESAIRWKSEMQRRMDRLGADGFYLLHNHPSGNATPSSMDISTTSFWAHTYPGLKGHVIINSGTYSFMTGYEGYGPTVENERLPNLPKGWKDNVLPAKARTKSPYPKITGKVDLAMMGLELKDPSYITVIFRGSNSIVRAIQEVPKDFFSHDGAAGWIKNRAVDYGAHDTFLFHINQSLDVPEIRSLIRKGYVKDAVWFHNTAIRSLYEQGARVSSDIVAYGKTIAELGPWRVAENEQDDIQYSIRHAVYNKLTPEEIPQKTQTVYKLMRLYKGADGYFFPLFARPDDGPPQAFTLGEWYRAEKQVPRGLADRSGIHAVGLPVFTQGKASRKGQQRAWVEALMPVMDQKTQEEADATPWLPNKQAREGIKKRVIGPGEAYNYRTNINSKDAESWPIAGSMRIGRVLSDDDVAEILRQAGKEQHIANSMTGISPDTARAMNAQATGKDPRISHAIRIANKKGIYDSKAVERASLDELYRMVDEYKAMIPGLNRVLKEKEAQAYHDQIRAKIDSVTRSLGTVKSRIREITGQVRVSDMVREKDALNAAFKKAERASRAAFKEGMTQGQEEGEQKGAVKGVEWGLQKGRLVGIDEMKYLMMVRRNAEDLRREVRTLKASITGMVKKAAKARMEPEYRDAVSGLADGSIDLASFIAQRERLGDILYIPDDDVRMYEGTNLKDMTLEELRNLHGLIKTMLYQGRKFRQIIEFGKAVDLADRVNEISKSVEKSFQVTLGQDDVLPVGPSERGLSRWQRITDNLEAMTMLLKKVEYITDWLDGFDKFGLVWRSVFKPTVDAERVAIARGREVAYWVDEAIDLIRDDLARITGERSITIADGRTWTHEEAIMVALNNGNEGNRKRLIEGYKLSPDDIDVIISHLTLKETQFVETIFDLVGSQRDEIAAVYRQLTGDRMKFVEGRYFPIYVDPELSDRAARRMEEQDLFRQIFHVASVARGFTIARTGGTEAPLLKLDVISNHLTRTNHFISHAVPVREVQKVVNHPVFKEAVIKSVGKHAYEQFQPWLKHIANPHYEALRKVDRALGWLRKNAITSLLGWSLSTALIQPTAYTQAMNRMGMLNSIEGLLSFYTDYSQNSDTIYGLSSFMASRTQHFDSDLRNLMEADADSIWRNDHVKKTYYALMSWTDKLVTLPTWWTAYNMEMRASGDQERAIEWADKMVRNTQSSGMAKDLAQAQAGSNARRIFVMFYGFMASSWNEIAKTHNMKALGKAGFSDVMKSYWWVLVLPGLINAIARQWREWPEEEPEEITKDLAKGVVAYGSSFIPILGSVVNAALGGWTFRPTPLSGLPEAATAAVKAFWSDEFPRALHHSVLATGYLFGIPARQIDLTAQTIIDAMEGEDVDLYNLVYREPKGGKR